MSVNIGSVNALDLIDDCCSPVLEEPLPEDQAARLAAAFKVLGDPARIRLLSLIGSREGGEACGCELIEPLGLSQPTVSHHLKVLHEAGLLEREKRGTWVYYRVAPASLAALGEALRVPVGAAAG
ncbi:MAG: metalloregulator ArsR/SmtB family transcription factor [Actinomycetota bacterium]|nr:metalloregulator ArsR/SmtB family transcription factor [Actinomycetota bacterium]